MLRDVYSGGLTLTGPSKICSVNETIRIHCWHEIRKTDSDIATPFASVLLHSCVLSMERELCRMELGIDNRLLLDGLDILPRQAMPLSSHGCSHILALSEIITVHTIINQQLLEQCHQK